MPSVAALWGYRLDSDDPLAWQADRICEYPQQLWQVQAWPQAAQAVA